MKEAADNKRHGGGYVQTDDEITAWYNAMNMITAGTEGVSKADFDISDKYIEATMPQ